MIENKLIALELHRLIEECGHPGIYRHKQLVSDIYNTGIAYTKQLNNHYCDLSEKIEQGDFLAEDVHLVETLAKMLELIETPDSYLLNMAVSENW